MNYEQTSYDIRAEIKRLEAEHGPKEAWGATFRLLQALEHLQAANRSLPRLIASRQRELSKAAWDKAAAMPTLSTLTLSDARDIALRVSRETEAAIRSDRTEDALRQRCFETK